jgi:hypothetical protein
VVSADVVSALSRRLGKGGIGEPEHTLAEGGRDAVAACGASQY